MGTITILGLGPGDAVLLTRQAWELLHSARVLYLRTAVHPTVAELPKHLELRPFDALYESAGAFGDIYEQIAADLVARAVAGEDVLYAVPGHPLIAEATTRRLLALARERGIEARVVAGLSFVEPVCAALGLDPLEHGLQLLDALDLVPHDEWRVTSDGVDAPGTRHPTPDTRHSGGAWSEVQGIGPYTAPLLPYPLAATRPALICQVYNRRVASNVKLSLMERYPAGHSVTLIRAAGVAGEEQVWTVPLHLLDHQERLDHLTCAYLPPLPPLADVRGPEGISYIVARLLGPGGCPWDREQTHQSIRKDLLEETYEALEALDAGDMHALAEELGDVLLHVLMHSEMARQAGDFDLGDVYEHIATKLIRRHPHVFGEAGGWRLEAGSDNQASSLQPLASGISVDQVLKNWDAIKREERAAVGHAPRGLLDGIPAGLPALMAAQETIRKASKAGFDSADQAWSWNKLHEEIDELQRAAHAEPHAGQDARAERLEEEFGDLMLAASKLGYRLKVDAESALRAATAKFRRRFAIVERLLREQGRELAAISVEEKEALWRQAKDDEQVTG
ncbi:MAG TPA: nucleoside triphosphate pyrophosphohydrolase [Roseiflexaceae bacterium]|nr:nucleoside triphosphate pyrophosphohydrolase [Roseiflexaceae bacterium]